MRLSCRSLAQKGMRSSLNATMRTSADDYIPTPDQGTTWYFLVGATTETADASELEVLARSYHEPAANEIIRDDGERNELHRGRVLLEGYDFTLRAYVIRKQGRDSVRLTMRPRSPQVNPVFLVTGWSEDGTVVDVDGG